MDPVTQAYKNCLDTAIERADRRLASGSLIDPSNNDLSMNNIQETLGWKAAVEQLSDLPGTLFDANMIEVSNEGA